MSDPASTDGMAELDLRRLQLAEIRRMLKIDERATHEEVLVAICLLYTGEAPALPVRYAGKFHGRRS